MRGITRIGLAGLLVAVCVGGAASEPRGTGDTSMHWAAQRGDVDGMKRLVESGADVNVENNVGETPMHFAARNGHVEAMKWLKENGSRFSIDGT